MVQFGGRYDIPLEQEVASKVGAYVTQQALPTGTLTFLFTDIEGSTKLWQHHADAMRQALILHDRIIEQYVIDYAGVVVRPRGEGDSRFAVFARPSDAVAAANAIQQALASEAWPPPIILKVRMALHTGETDLRAADYYGAAVNLCARLRSIAHGGQTLLSQATTALAREILPKDVSLRDMGVHQLKDIGPERVFQLLVPGIVNDFPPLTSRNRPTNLQLLLPPLVGREKEVEIVCGYLQQQHIRLLSLTGPGGVGKTRLALKSAAQLLEVFEDGVFLVELASISDYRLVQKAIAKVFHIADEGRQSPGERLASYIEDKQLLLVLDNFEQVIKAKAVIIHLLSKAPRLKIVVTSRVSLHIDGEQEFEVKPLELPRSRQRLSIETLSQFEAVALFIARAQAVRSDFHITDHNAPAVAEICSRLDGLPLAIELAAAQIKGYSPQELLDQLSHRLNVLKREQHIERANRQRTMRSAIAWSYDLLEADEQQLFAQLGVFVGGCTYDAALAVCQAPLQEGLGSGQTPSLHTPDGLRSLVDKSLLRREEDIGGTSRFTMLETIREYALELLHHNNHTVKLLQRRHALYFLKLVEQAEPELISAAQEHWLQRLEHDHDNIRAALDWARSHGEWEILIRLAVALWRFWYTCGYLSEGCGWLELGLKVVEAKTTGRIMSDTSLSNEQQQLDIDLDLWAKLLTGAGGLKWAQGHYLQAQSYYENSLSLYRELNDKIGIAHALGHIGVVAHDQGNHVLAQRYYSQSLEWHEGNKDVRGMARALNNLGLLARDSGDHSLAHDYYSRCLALFEQLRDGRGSALALSNLAEVACDQGDYDLAKTFYCRGLMQRQVLGDREGVAYGLEGLASVAIAQGQVERAAWLWGAAEALREMIGAPIPPADRATYNRTVDEARKSIAPSPWKVAWESGRSASTKDALQFACMQGI